MDLQEARILITGGAGFIGANLAHFLSERGAQITIYDDFSVGSLENIKSLAGKVTVVNGKIENFESVKRAIADQEYVFHLAANASVPISSENPRYDFETNLLGTFNVLESLRTMKSPANLLLTSSAAVYGRQNILPMQESTELKPCSPYGASKLAAEIMCQTFHRVYDLPAVCVRFFNVYGPLQRKYVMFDIMKKLRQDKNRLEVIGTGLQIRDFLYVSDAIDACLLLIRTQSAFGNVYNVATGIGTKIQDLVTMLLEILELDEKTDVVYTRKSWAGDIEKLLADTTKINTLGFKPKVDLKEGLSRFVSWFNASYGENEKAT